MRQIQYKWLGKDWVLTVHPLGDAVCDMFQPPSAMALLPWLLAEGKGTFVDVGAHVGTFAIHAASFFAEVVAFEPEARNLVCLKQNIRQNKIPNFTLIPWAVSDSCGVSTFFITETIDTGRNSLLPMAGGKSVEVQTVSIESMFSSELSKHPPIAFVKIDVEGFEPKVIKGAAAIIDQQKIKPVMHVEFTPAKWAKQEADVYWLFEYLSANNYVPFIPASGFIAPVTFDVIKQIYESWKTLRHDAWLDLTFIPAERSSQEHIMDAWGRACQIVEKLH